MIDFKIERLIMKLGKAINSMRDGDLSKYNLSSAQSETILYYADHSGESIKELALHLKITHQAAKKLVDKLRIKDILMSVTSSDDKRYSKVYLTDKGETLCAELKKNGSHAGERMLCGLTDSEKVQLLFLLEKVEHNSNNDQ